jgi:leucyl-tRNA synthetase
LIDVPWPKWDEEAIKEERITIVIQINGKVRARMEVAVGLSQEEVEKMALEQPRIKELIADKEIKKIIWVPNKLVNIVVK